jgi:hypothetical protein
MKIRFILAAVATMATFSAPAFADMTVKSQDGTMELALPNGWHEGKAEGPASKIVAVDGRGSRVAVRVYPKEDFKDAKGVANFAVSKLKLLDNDGVKSEDIQLGGKPAVRLTLTGTSADGMKAGFIVTAFESDGMYTIVVAKSDAAGFAKQTPLLTGFAGQLKMTPAAPGGTSAKPAATPPK